MNHFKFIFRNGEAVAHEFDFLNFRRLDGLLSGRLHSLGQRIVSRLGYSLGAGAR